MPKITPELSIVNIVVDKKKTQPLYQQLYDGIRNAILNGAIRAGERLPATRQLSADLKISRNIVSLAFEQLMLEGYLTGKVGSGTFVSSTLPDNFIKSKPTVRPSPEEKPKINKAPFKSKNNDILSRNTAKEEVVPFQNAVPAIDIFPFKIWNRIVAREYKEISTRHLGYDDAYGYRPLRESIASYLRSARGVRCEADQVLIINGTQQGLSLCAHVVLKNGDEVLIEDPGYAGARAAFANYGAKIIPVPVETDGVDVSFIEKHHNKAKIIYITPAHQYPLGGTLSLSKRMDLLRWAAKTNTWIIEDDYDSELRYTGRPLAALQGLDQSNKVIYIGTFSKVLFPGLRIAYMVLPTQKIADYFKAVKAVFDRQSPIMEQVITNTFIREGHFSRHLRKMRLEYHERQKMLIKAIEKDLGGKLYAEEQAAGMHLIGWLPKKSNDRGISASLLKHGIITNSLSEYTLKYARGPGLILGYTAFNKFKLRHYVQKMNQILK
jgi:GntR family transcriptional regulator / MocR family aminotransferase